MKLNEFIKISPGFKAAVNLQQEMNNLQKVAGFIPTEVSQEILLDFARKIHPTLSDHRSRIVMGTYGTGKSHLALVIANFFMRPLNTPELTGIIDKIDAETRQVLINNRRVVCNPFLAVTLYGDEGRIADGLMRGLCNTLINIGMEELLPESAFNAAVSRIHEVENNYSESYDIFKNITEQNGYTVSELITRLENYDKTAFNLFCEIHPQFSSGSQFVYSTMLDPGTFYKSVAKELILKRGYAGIVVLWDEFGQKMEEVVKDPSGREGIDLQEFAEQCNYSEDYPLHFYLFCHRSLKEYHDISKLSIQQDYRLQREEDFRKIEGRFKPFIMKSTDTETFQLIDRVIIADEQSSQWKSLMETYNSYFNELCQQVCDQKYFVGLSTDEIKSTVMFGCYPLHPMAVYGLPAVSEKVAQNNRTLFTCLCENDPGGLFRFLQNARLVADDPSPLMFTIDMLWDYFANDIKQQERTYPIYRDYQKLIAYLDSDDNLSQRILKAVSIFRVINPTRFKITESILIHGLNILASQVVAFNDTLEKISDHKNEKRVLMRMSDGSYRTSVSHETESLVVKIRKLLSDSTSRLSPPIKFLKTIWSQLNIPDVCEATSYWDEYGVKRELKVLPVNLNQVVENKDALTTNIGGGEYWDGILLAVLCEDSFQIEKAKTAAMAEQQGKYGKQVVWAIPKQPVQIFDVLNQYQALMHLKKDEANLYAEFGELHEEWRLWHEDIYKLITDKLSSLFNPSNQLLEYYWDGNLKSDILNLRKLKSLASDVMRDVFPFCPSIGDDKLAQDDFSGNWGYRPNCRDVALKLTRQDIAADLFKETSAQQKHVIDLLLRANGFLYKNHAGEPVIGRPSDDKNPAGAKLYDCIAAFAEKAKKKPVEMKDIVKVLRRPPYGAKCRALPVLFAAAVHRDLSLGNLSFEYLKNPQSTEKIKVFESDTLEKIFASPDKYKLIYVDVSSNQREIIAGLAKVFSVELDSIYLPLERVKRVGEQIASWWRNLPRHAQLTEKLSEWPVVFKEHIFNPLAQIDADIDKILLLDIFEHVFQVESDSVKREIVCKKIQPIKLEFDTATDRLKARIADVFKTVFDSGESDTSGAVALVNWFKELSEDKCNCLFSGPSSTLANWCRKTTGISDDDLYQIAKDITGLDMEAWSDDMIMKFAGKIETAKETIDAYETPPPPPLPLPPPPIIDPLEPNQTRLTLLGKDGQPETRIFQISVELSQNGKAMENMLNTTVDSIGRGLDDKEKMVVLYRFIRRHFFGESVF